MVVHLIDATGIARIAQLRPEEKWTRTDMMRETNEAREGNNGHFRMLTFFDFPRRETLLASFVGNRWFYSFGQEDNGR